MAGRPKGSSNFKTWVRFEKIARLETLGVPDAEIALQTGLTAQGLANAKQSAGYKAVRLRIATGVLSQYDGIIAEDNEYVQTRIREMVPTALEALFDNVTQKLDPKLRQNAAETILDRDGRLAKVSRVGLPTQDQGGFAVTEKDIEMATQLALLVKKQKEEEKPVVNVTEGPVTIQ